MCEYPIIIVIVIKFIYNIVIGVFIPILYHSCTPISC